MRLLSPGEGEGGGRLRRTRSTIAARAVSNKTVTPAKITILLGITT
jgi:hypothetical protein